MFFGKEMDNRNKYIENKIEDYLNSQKLVIGDLQDKEPRAVASIIEKLICGKFEKLFIDIIKTYTPSTSRKSMEDIAYYDEENNYYAIDIKTHRLNDSSFHMPNLISIKRLNDFYRESNKNHLMILKVDYNDTEKGIEIKKVTYNQIEFYAWECLRIGALGWGQIQIANANSITIKESIKEEWMASLCNKVIDHYRKEMIKIEKTRLVYFSNEKKYWENQIKK